MKLNVKLKRSSTLITLNHLIKLKRWWTDDENYNLKNLFKNMKSKIGRKSHHFFKKELIWQKVLNPDFVKGPLTQEEDEKLIQLVSNQGPKNWGQIAKHLPRRIGKQFRERFHNHLDPKINKEKWTDEEDKLHKVFEK